MGQWLLQGSSQRVEGKEKPSRVTMGPVAPQPEPPFSPPQPTQTLGQPPDPALRHAARSGCLRCLDPAAGLGNIPKSIPEMFRTKHAASRQEMGDL